MPLFALLLGLAAVAPAAPAKAFDGFVKEMSKQGYRGGKAVRSLPAMVQHPIFSCQMQQPNRMIRVLVTLHASPQEVQKAIHLRKTSMQAAQTELSDFHPNGLTFAWVGRPYAFVSYIAVGRVLTEFWQFEKDPGGALVVAAAKNPAVLKSLKTIGANLRQRTSAANSVLAKNP